MSVSANIRRSINAAYGDLMFEKLDFRRTKEIDGDWVAISDFRVRQLDAEIWVDLDLGLFSRRIHEIQHGFSPNWFTGVSQCHFFASVFSLNEGEWNPDLPQTLTVSSNEDKREITRFVRKQFVSNVPAAIERYANWKSIVENRRRAVGANARYRDLRLHAGAALVLLGKYDEVLSEMEGAIKAGTDEYFSGIYKHILSAAGIGCNVLEN